MRSDRLRLPTHKAAIAYDGRTPAHHGAWTARRGAETMNSDEWDRWDG